MTTRKRKPKHKINPNVTEAMLSFAKELRLLADEMEQGITAGICVVTVTKNPEPDLEAIIGMRYHTDQFPAVLASGMQQASHEITASLVGRRMQAQKQMYEENLAAQAQANTPVNQDIQINQQPA